MIQLWQSLSPMVQDGLFTLFLLLPGVVVGGVTLHGYTPWPLARAILWRFRGTVSLFILLIAVSVGMGIALSAQERGLRKGTAMAADKFDLVVAAPGSELTALFAAVYLQPSDMGLLSGETFNAIASHDKVAFAAPLAFGDSYHSSSVVGTTADFLEHLSEGNFEGRIWATEEEAVIGALVPLEIGDDFEPAHGEGDAEDGEAHEGFHIQVVGRMAPTGTPWDRAILVPVETVWSVHGLANGHGLDRGDQIGPPFDPELFPGTPAIVVHPKELWASYALRSEFTRDAESMAFFPGSVLSNLYRIMGDVRQAMSLMAVLTQTLVAASVLLGLFILTRLFQRQIALLRAIGAPSRFVFALMWSFGATLLVTGTVLGLASGIGFAAWLSTLVTERTDIHIVAQLGWTEIHAVAAFVSLSLILSLLPAALVMRSGVVATLRN